MKKILITLNDQGGAVMNWNYSELAATLRSQMSNSHPPIVVIEDEKEKCSDNDQLRTVQGD